MDGWSKAMAFSDFFVNSYIILYATPTHTHIGAYTLQCLYVCRCVCASGGSMGFVAIILMACVCSCHLQLDYKRERASVCVCS